MSIRVRHAAQATRRLAGGTAFPCRLADDMRRTSQRGVGMTELLVAFALAAVLITISVPSLIETVKQQQGRSFTMQARGLVQLAQMKSLKEKVEHRVVFHDENAGTPNRIELQMNQSGSFVTLADHVYAAPNGVRILGGNSSSITTGTRGSCNAGKLAVESVDGTVYVLKVDARCHTSMG